MARNSSTNKSHLDRSPHENTTVPTYSDRPIFKLVGTVGPIMTVIITSALYLAGSSANGLILEHYGLTSGILDKSLQQTIVDGYYGLVRGLPLFIADIISLKAVVLGLVGIAVGVLVGLQLVKHGKEEIVSRSSWIVKSYRILVSIAVAFVAFHLSAVSAGLAAQFDIARIDKAVAEGCVQCRIYRTEKGDFSGTLIDADKQRAVIVQRGGIRLLMVDQLRAVLQPPTKSDVVTGTSRKPGGPRLAG